MPIIVRLDYILLERNISLTELAEKVDITLANLSILKTNKARAIRFSTLEGLCRALNCQPGDLLEFVDDADPETDAPDTSLPKA
jgi:putative transcriptional regulator